VRSPETQLWLEFDFGCDQLHLVELAPALADARTAIDVAEQ
jgi:hypothetical protein